MAAFDSYVLKKYCFLEIILSSWSESSIFGQKSKMLSKLPHVFALGITENCHPCPKYRVALWLTLNVKSQTRQDNIIYSKSIPHSWHVFSQSASQIPVDGQNPSPSGQKLSKWPFDEQLHHSLLHQSPAGR